MGNLTLVSQYHRKGVPLHPTGSADTFPLPGNVTIGYGPPDGDFYVYKRGYPVSIISASYNVVDSTVFQRNLEYPDQYAPGYHVVLDTGPVVTVRLD